MDCVKLRSHNEIIDSIAQHACLFYCKGHTAMKRFNDIVAITVMIVFLAVNAILSMIFIACDRNLITIWPRALP